MTNIIVQRLDTDNQADLNRCGNSFTVEAELSLAAEDGRISDAVRPVTPYVKRYSPEIFNVEDYIGKPDHAAWLVYIDG